MPTVISGKCRLCEKIVAVHMYYVFKVHNKKKLKPTENINIKSVFRSNPPETVVSF